MSQDNVNQDPAGEVLRAKNDSAFRNEFIGGREKFILACAYKASGRFVSKSDDEWSVALIAFNEAIDSYEPEKGSFNAFASVVIKRRIIDHQRSELRHAGEIPVDRMAIDGDTEDETGATALSLEVREREARLSREKAGEISGSVTVKDEIEALSQVLSDYGFSFFDLTEVSPKAEKTKRACADAIRHLLSQGALVDKMRSSRTLPIAEIQKNTGVPRKILERHRKYIIAASEILGGDYPLLSGYMSYIKKGGRDSAGFSPVVTTVLMMFMEIVNYV